MLTKSNFLLGRQCEKALWLRFNKDEVRDVVGPGLQRLFDEGHIVGRLAHSLFQNGHLIKTPSANWRAALTETSTALDKKFSILFEPAFLFEEVLVRPDILCNEPEGWNLIEVKSSTSIKDEHIDDVALQLHVLRGAGLQVARACLLHVNSEFIRNGEVDVESFFIQEDVTARAEEILKNVPALLERFRAVIALKDMPTLEVGSHCKNPYPCRYTTHCWKMIPATSVHYLPNLRENKRTALIKDGIFDQKQIPDSFGISDKQKVWVQSAKTGAPVADHESLKKFLDDLQYPIAFLDFETVNTAIPPFDGLSPFHQLPFQASVHITEENGSIRHEEFLGDATTDPREPLAKFLVKTIPNSGSIVAYYASFEKGRLEQLADHVTENSVALRNFIARLIDLRDPFADGHYVDSRCYGSTSIKEVLPVLVPAMTYEGLAIAEGGAAAAAYIRLMKGTLEAAEKNRIRNDLGVYCGQDTLAMVKVLQALRKIVTGVR